MQDHHQQLNLKMVFNFYKIDFFFQLFILNKKYESHYYFYSQILKFILFIKIGAFLKLIESFFMGLPEKDQIEFSKLKQAVENGIVEHHWSRQQTMSCKY